MFGPDWTLSPRRYDVATDADVRIPLPDGNSLAGFIVRPVTAEPVPVIAGFHPYSNEFQTGPLMPEGFSRQRGWMESGDPAFFARRGYAHGVFNVRGTGQSSGYYQAMGPLEARDAASAVQWLAGQPWCSGAVGTFGISYFAWLQVQTAMLRPPGLRCIFAPFGATDFYRDFLYHGGILSYRFLTGWRHNLDGLRYRSWFADRHGEPAFSAAVAQALADDEIAAVPELVACLRSPTGPAAFVTDIVLARFDTDFWAERRVSYADTSVPAYLGACWGLDGLHLAGALRSYSSWQGPRKLIVGPDVYLDRPLYQLQYEALRWFDHWLKGNDTGLLDEPSARFFLAGRWREAQSWPLPSTRWTPFYLHGSGLLSEHEFFLADSSSAFEDSPFRHGSLAFLSPPLVEETELLGPAVLDVYVSSTDSDALLMVSVLGVDPDGTEQHLARGWLRASQAAEGPGSRPWAPHHEHLGRAPLAPGEVRRLRIGFAGLGACLRPGQRIGLRIKAADDEDPPDPLRAVAYGHVCRQNVALITVHHRDEHPSALYLPVTAGNILGTFLSGGHLPPVAGPIPYAKIQRQKGDSAHA